MYKPKVLYIDIETAPLVAYVWGLWSKSDLGIGLNQLVSDWYVLSWASKWEGEKKVYYMDQRNAKDIENDKVILKELWKLMDEADIIVGHNLDKFDIKKLNVRFILNGLKPPSHYRTEDTLKLARKKFAFTSNKLSYLTDKLCKKYKKLNHGKFAGFELWKQCLRGNKSAWREMEEYNKYDVLSLEELHQTLIPWSSTINIHQNSGLCNCGGKLTKNGFVFTNGAKHLRLRCQTCGSEYKEKSSFSTNDYKKI